MLSNIQIEGDNAFQNHAWAKRSFANLNNSSNTESLYYSCRVTSLTFIKEIAGQNKPMLGRQ
jgi:hypothetical protein